MDGLLMAPVDRSAIFFGKALGNLIFIGIVELALLPLCTVLFGASLLRPAVLLVVALGTIGYAGAGTLLAAVAVNTRAREVLLPVLLLPLVVPALIAAVKATAWLVDGGSLVEVTGWVNLLVVYDLVMLAVSMLTFEYAVSE
jgi:heme exporter protein B